MYLYLAPLVEAIFGADDISPIETSLSPGVAMPKFVCGILMHYSLTDSIERGVEMMKFALNHPWKFKDPHTAFYCGFTYSILNYVVEVFNFMLLSTSTNVLGCFWNFLGVNVIRNLGSFIYNPIRHSP